VSVTLRLATTDDARFVYDVNNDPAARAQSISARDIPWEEHERWFGKKLGDPKGRVFIALAEARPVAVVRFDVSGTDAVFGIAVARGEQGKGYAAPTIAAAVQQLASMFPGTRGLAWIRPGNEASRRAFMRAGFVAAGSGAVDGVTLDRYEHPG
jgi:RimJ/RimL family protein N-acetyltransferase